jgi:hypothetical protein
MSLPISALTAIAKTSIGATHYLPLADGTAANYKLLIQDLFPAMNTLGTTSEALFVSVTNKNTLNFKGIKSLNNLLTVATASNNITLEVNEGNINLDNCDNSVSQFLSGSIDLTSAVTGILPVANGGTGLTTLTANSLFVGNGTSALTALGVATNGQIPIGRTGLSPVLATLTQGTNVTITNGVGSITIAASLTTLTANLNGAGYNIYGLGWLSGDGQNEGIAINSSGRVFIGSSTPTAFYNADLNVNNSIALNGSTIQYISMGSVTTPNWLIIEGADALGLNTAGGNVAINAGDATGTGSGGTTYIAGGASTASTGFGGGVTLNGGGSLNGNAGTININAGQASGTGGGGNIALRPGTSTSGTGGVVAQEAGSSTRAFTNFIGSETALSATSLSTSTASAGNKVGAIKVQINGVDKWIRVYDSAI